jgi:hypothetical protein
MKTRNILFALISLLFTSCAKKEWCVGEWEFDRPHTESNISGSHNAPVAPVALSGIPSMQNMQNRAKAQVTTMLLKQMDGITMKITPDEITWIMSDETEKVVSYEIVKQSEENTLKLKSEDGQITTLYKIGERLAMDTTGDVDFKIYFKRKK